MLFNVVLYYYLYNISRWIATGVGVYYDISVK